MPLPSFGSRSRARRSAAVVLALAALLSIHVSNPGAVQAQKAGDKAAKPAAAKAAPKELAAVKAALEKYKDPIAAVRDGYFSSVGCIEFPKGGGEGQMHYAPGGMGVHFLNMANVGPNLDPMKPQVLLYEPVGDKLVLAGAEYFVPVQASGGKRPSVMGHELEGPMEGHKPIMPDGLHHYDLHVWMWKDNPNGMFSPTNSNIKCPAGSYTYQDAPPKMVSGK